MNQNRSLRKYPWPSLKVGQTLLFRAHGKERKRLLRATLLRSAAYFRKQDDWGYDAGFSISTHEVGRGVVVTRES